MKAGIMIEVPQKGDFKNRHEWNVIRSDSTMLAKKIIKLKEIEK